LAKYSFMITSHHTKIEIRPEMATQLENDRK